MILVIDEDGFAERIQELQTAQEEQVVTAAFPRALGIAIRTFDAWMLADEQALSKVLQCVVSAQPSPEDNRRPKESCESLMADKEYARSQSEFYAELAAIIDLAQLERRCPRGFGEFARRLKSL